MDAIGVLMRLWRTSFWIRWRTPRSRVAGISCLALAFLTGGSSDPGVVLELDLGTLELQARDLRAGEPGPRFSVATGSPAHPTPQGSFRVYQVVHNPAWAPGETARSYGAVPIPASKDGPLGIGKIVFARDGIALHGGADPILLGKPVSLGCVRARDRDFERLIAWLDARRALHETRPQPDGESHQRFRRPIRVVVR